MDSPLASPPAMNDSLLLPDSDVVDAGFAFARIRGAVHLVYAPTLPSSTTTTTTFALPSSPLKPSTASPAADTPIPVFRHDFVAVFRFSHLARAADLRLLERLPADAVRYEPESGTVFLAHDAALRMRALDKPSSMGMGMTIGARPPAYRAVPRARTTLAAARRVY